MQDFITVLVLVVAVRLFGIGIYRSFILQWRRTAALKKAQEMRFLQVKIPQKSSDLDQKNDNIQNMKQNIEIMNQVLKNFYAVYSNKWKANFLVQNYVSMELLVEKEMIKFMIGVPKDYVETIEKNISSFYPGSVIDYIDQPKLLDAGKYLGGGTFTLSKKDAFPIKTYETFEADPMESILSAFSRVDNEEKLCLQILLAPVSEKMQENMRKSIDDIKEGKKKETFWSMLKDIIPKSDKKDDKKEKKNTKYSSQQMGDLDKKTEDELYNVTIKALATSPHPHRIDIVLNDLARSMSQYGYVGLNSLNFSKVKTDRIGDFTSDFVRRIFDNGATMTKFFKRQLLNIKELSSIFHFPHNRFNRSPRIKWQSYKVVPAPDGVPNDGIQLGYNLFAGVKRVIKLKDKDRFRHFYIIGQTGTGKSSIMVTMLKQDIEQGRGCMVIDPHGELCETIMKYYPKERIDDLIYFDASNFEYPLGVNIFTAQNEDERNLVVSDLVDMFIGMYGHEVFGPRIQDYFSNAALTLMEQPDGGTMTEIVRMFTDPAFQKIKLQHVTNPVVRNWWEKTYASMGDREKGEMIPFFQAKFGPFITNSMIRNIIGQPKSSFDVSEAMQKNKVILVNLSKGLLGEFNSQLLGRMMVTQVKVAALRRAGMPEHERVPFFLYIDEMQNYVSKSIESVLSEARKYKLGMVMAHQYIDQLKTQNLGGSADLSTAIFGNVGNILSYRVGPTDAEFLEKQFSPVFSQQDLMNLDQFKCCFKMEVDGQSIAPFSMNCIKFFQEYVTLNTAEKVQIMKQISALKWGRKRDLVEKEIYYRVGV